jgi:CelD/BcsL family acetyltransferase involved in cellulose biosynthesis
MQVYEIDPTTDERWNELLQQHPLASIFHTQEWLLALRQTYKYEPIAFTTSPPGCTLTNAVPFCTISGWFGGRRLVSLPFSDHCDPLIEKSDQLTCLLDHLQRRLSAKKWSHIEIRPTDLRGIDCGAFGNGKAFFFHKLDLKPSLDVISKRFHKDCVQRKINRAVREGLTYAEGRSDVLVANFYHLLLGTRRRQGLPPQPIQWFRNLIACLGSKVTIRVASKDGRPLASIVTLRYKSTLVYKYGCLDHGFNKLGGTHLLFWNAIQEAKQENLSEFDMGRSDFENPGLAAFKDRWGAARTRLTYLRYPPRNVPNAEGLRRPEIRKYVWSHAPNSMLAVAGRLLYKYMG